MNSCSTSHKQVLLTWDSLPQINGFSSSKLSRRIHSWCTSTQTWVSLINATCRRTTSLASVSQGSTLVFKKKTWLWPRIQTDYRISRILQSSSNLWQKKWLLSNPFRHKIKFCSPPITTWKYVCSARLAQGSWLNVRCFYKNILAWPPSISKISSENAFHMSIQVLKKKRFPIQKQREAKVSSRKKKCRLIRFLAKIPQSIKN